MDMLALLAARLINHLRERDLEGAGTAGPETG
jgi:hypothetical protein